jgi:glycosyltransferase involved in cell wall biosynthesis
MKLLMITGSFPPIKCGVGDYCAKLANALANQEKWRVIVLTDSGASKGVTSDSVTLLPCVNDWSWRGIRKLFNIVRSQCPDIVHIQYPTAGYRNARGIYYLPFLLRMSGIRVVQTWHEPTSRLRYLTNALANTLIVVPEPDYAMRVQFYYQPLISRRLRYIPVSAAIPSSTMNDYEISQLRSEFGSSNRMLVYFGFAVPMKGIEQIFEVADHQRDVLVLICSLDPANNYHNELLKLTMKPMWRDRVVVTGFLSADKVANLLAVADAAIFPFPGGVGMRNTSVLAARAQGTFTLTTASHRQGYDAAENVFYVSPGDLGAMRTALDRYAGCRRKPSVDGAQSWAAIAKAHMAVYEEVLLG